MNYLFKLLLTGFIFYLFLSLNGFAQRNLPQETSSTKQIIVNPSEKDTITIQGAKTVEWNGTVLELIDEGLPFSSYYTYSLRERGRAKRQGKILAYLFSPNTDCSIMMWINYT